MFKCPCRTWLSTSVLSQSAAPYVGHLQRHGYSLHLRRLPPRRRTLCVLAHWQDM